MAAARQLLSPEHLLRELRRMAAKLRRRVLRIDQRTFRVAARGSGRGRALLSFIADPFTSRDASRIGHSHTHFWESWRMARSLAAHGYEVDVISWTNHEWRPEHHYDVLIDVRFNLERLAPLLPDAVKVAHLDTAHHRFHNHAQEQRLAALERRRGVRLRQRKTMPETRTIETCDVATYLGNDFTRSTYAFAGKPMVRTPVSVPDVYNWPAGRDLAAIRRRFLWFGSGGLVHKGLDLVLEAFATTPELDLWVCGPIAKEPEFAREYRHELFRLPNVHTLDWVDIRSPRFAALRHEVGALVYPSCSEGGGSSALTCMHGGIVPLLTESSSVDLEPERGIVLDDIHPGAIAEAVRAFAALDPQRVEAMSRAAWEFARSHHSREHFAAAYDEFTRRLAAGELPLVEPETTPRDEGGAAATE